MLTAKHGKGVLNAAFDPSGTLAVTASADHTAAVWRVATGERLLSAGHEGPVNAAGFN